MIELSNQELCVSGKIDFSNAEQYYQKGLQLIRKQQLPLVVNLAQLTTREDFSFGRFGAMVASDA